MARGLETINRKLPIMLGKQINSSVITLMILLIILSSSSCAWQGRFYIVNDTSSDILFARHGNPEAKSDFFCLFEKSDTILYRSKDNCFQTAEFSKSNDSRVYSTVIPPNHVLYKGRGPLSMPVIWVIKDPETMEVIDDLNDLWHWKVYPETFISFRRVFVYEIVDSEEENDQ